ncbi:MAG: hypothetical protein AB7G39_18300 [Alphaproteobacteria bacterium]
MRWWLALVAFAMLPLGGAAAQQPAPSEFMKPVYDASACVSMFQKSIANRTSVYARNDCGREVRMLGCYRILHEGMGYDRTGWYCDFTIYAPGYERIVAQMGTFGSRMKWAACFTPNPGCDQRLGTIHTRMRNKGTDPEEIGRILP